MESRVKDAVLLACLCFSITERNILSFIIYNNCKLLPFCTNAIISSFVQRQHLAVAITLGDFPANRVHVAEFTKHEREGAF